MPVPLAVLCSDLGGYESVAAAWVPAAPSLAVPVLGDGGPRALAGLPRGTRAVPASDWRPRAAPPGDAARGAPPGAGRCIVAAPEPHCRAVASFVAAACGKQAALPGDEGAWERAVAELAAARPRSLTLVVPGWSTGAGAAAWIARTVELVRAQADRAGPLAWGLLTGPDPQALSLLAAKAALDGEIAASYRGAGTLVVSEIGEAWARCLPEVSGEAAPLAVASSSTLAGGGGVGLLERPWELIVFRTHARHYCGSHGYLCGARRHDADPAAPLPGCVNGFDCYDPSWPQVDPRRYDAPVTVLDSCNAADTTSPLWDEGIPSLAFLAAAGPASAVVSGDGPTVTSQEAGIDPLAALAECATVGEAVARINTWRPRAHTPYPYLLVGDPDLAAGRDRFPGLASLPYPRAPLPRAPGPGRITLVRPAEHGAIAGARALTLPSGPEVWAVPASEAGPEGGARADGGGVPGGGAGPAGPLAADVVTVPSLPAGSVAAARGIAQLTSGWFPDLDEGRDLLAGAAGELARVADVLARHDGRTLEGTSAGVHEFASTAVEHWAHAHAAVVSLVAGRAERGLWPNSLWEATAHGPVRPAGRCAGCAREGALLRDYRSGATGRTWWECRRCQTFVTDLPAGPGVPRLEVTAPARLRPLERATARVRLVAAAPGAVGCGLAVVDTPRDRHGIACQPTAFAVRLAGGETLEVDVQLAAELVAPTFHFYRLVVLVLVDGVWLWSARPIRLERPAP